MNRAELRAYFAETVIRNDVDIPAVASDFVPLLRKVAICTIFVLSMFTSTEKLRALCVDIARGRI